MRALITGITGQDGSYLAELLLEKGYQVFGLVRRKSVEGNWRIAHILDKLTLIEGDMIDAHSLGMAVRESRPDEVYNLAAQSCVAHSFKAPEATMEITGLGAVKLFESCRLFAPDARIYQASSSEMYGDSPPMQSESTKFRPRSPYAAAKTYAHHMANVCRERGQFVSCGILFNHESPRRGLEFVTRKIANGAVRIKKGLQEKLILGNIESRRDWGHAKDYVRAMWLMLQQYRPGDFVIGTGVARSVKSFVDAAFEECGLVYWKELVAISQSLYRPLEVEHLCADSRIAKEVLGWEPQISFEDMVAEMVQAEYERC